ncbi:ISH3 family transposase [Leptolyngbya sp. FACHB-671]|uniref:ISH3 family transposase n=1 Tax=Leptolyngbya sp. FACHB-671 TaxID=2692812 RepID=UPI0016864D54|nr:ISH3 family transposase [Leptolyngbya sp. FACHB-671]MBD2069004.1 ISH3 family transposase [Leptolyngbya sp. FACHB-671]
MTSYPLSLSSTPALTDEATLETALDCLLEHLPIEMEGGYTPSDLFAILLRAASRNDSIEHTSQRLEGVPSGNGIRYHLDKLDDIATVERQLNGAMQSRIPAKICKGKHRIAIDLHLIPYYGTPTDAEAPYIYRSQAKAGTTTFFAYATVYVICRNKRVTLAIHAVHRQETLVATITYLLAMLHPLKVRVKRLYLDRGFYSVPVIRWLKALNLPFLMPAVIRGKTGGTRQLLVGRTSYATPYTLNSPHYGSVICQMRVVCNYYKGFKGKHGIQYTLYVVHRVKVALHQLHRHYKDRFGIETSYRIKNHCRIRTTTKNPVTRFLFVALAFLLVNLWVYLLWHFVSQTQRGGRVVYRALFSLKTMLEFLCHAVERHFPPITAIYLPTP